MPGAAISPLYAALRRRGSVRHILARHVEAASHMADGYSRARAGNIGVCIGTSGPAGTDMITGLYTPRRTPCRSCASRGRRRAISRSASRSTTSTAPPATMRCRATGSTMSPWRSGSAARRSGSPARTSSRMASHVRSR
nr:thiamine pyrophosphate-binding protein [uncultured Lichenicoccus sp.]